MKKIFFKKTGIIILSSIIGLNFSLFNISDSNRNYIYVNATTSADFNISDNGMAFICSLEGYAQTCFWDNSQCEALSAMKCGRKKPDFAEYQEIRADKFHQEENNNGKKL